MLRGARIVVAQETDQGRHWNEARIKALTAADPVTARYMRADFFTYRPHFKLFIAGNHKPALRCVDEAMRRRFSLIPFSVTIKAPDFALPRKLEAEWPGILAWMIAGCLAWQRTGLAPPAAVTEATAGYLAAEDTFGAWLDELIRVAPESASETTADLFASWASYAQAAQEPVGSKKAFGHAIQARGFVPHRIGQDRTRGYKGIRLVRPAAAGGPAVPAAARTDAD
jgi:putative DNA primase/helicase